VLPDTKARRPNDDHGDSPLNASVIATAIATGILPRVYCRATAAAPFLNTYFWILPVAVLGSSGTNVTP
jgi:hypothetical protein